MNGDRIHCLECGMGYDVATAEWCDCDEGRPTLICQHCGWCFCDAPAVYSIAFWDEALSQMITARDHRAVA